jgi:hypothetical protein
MSIEDKKEFIELVRKMSIEKEKYIPQGGKLAELENLCLDAMVGSEKEKREFAELVFLVFFTTLSLKEKMRIDGLVSDFIDDDLYPRLDFNSNLMSIVKDDFIFDQVAHSEDLYSLRKQIQSKVIEAQK